MEITQSSNGGITVVSLTGRFDAQSAGQVDASLQQAVQGAAARLVVDMAKVEYVSSAGLRVLLAVAKKVGSGGGRLVLCGLQPYVLEVFEVAGFTAIFQIMPDASQALASMQP